MVGRAVIRALLDGGHQVTALTHTPGNAPALEAAGARPGVGDMREPGGWIEAVRDADAVVHMAQLTPSGRVSAKAAAAAATADLVATDALRAARNRRVAAMVTRPGTVYGPWGTFARFLLQPNAEKGRAAIPGGGGNRAGNAVGGMQLVIPGSLLTDSGILDNVAEEGWGGGMVLGAGAEVRNTTISGNRANRAGAVHLGFGGGTMNGVTVVGNTAETNGAGIRFFDPAQAVLTNVLMAGNLLEDGTATNCFFDQQVPPASRGHNLSDDDSCAPVLTQQGDLSGVEAGVDPDPDHEAGPTPFHPLLEGSAAIGAGHPDRCLATDQRGFGRGAPCDIGAIEFGGTAPGAMRTEVAPGSWFVVRPGSAGRSMTPQGAVGGFGAADAVAPVSER